MKSTTKNLSSLQGQGLFQYTQTGMRSNTKLMKINLIGTINKKQKETKLMTRNKKKGLTKCC